MTQTFGETEATRSEGAVFELCGVRKQFGHVTALDGVSLSVAAGEVLGIVGDNGAGKSTLIKIMSGVLQPDTGELRVNGQALHLKSPVHARAAGIATVFQNLALVECLDVATNMFLGQLPSTFGFVRRRRMERDSRKFLDDLNITVRSVRTPVGMLSGGQRQIVSIARALRLATPVVLLDEPTAALGVRETKHTADLIRDLRDRGKAVVFVSHDLELVFAVADRVQVLRLGQTNGVRVIKDSDRDEIVGLITGSRRDREATGTL